MHGRLFTLFEGVELFGQDLTTPVPSYFVLLLSGFLLATLFGVLWARRIGQNGDVVVDLGLAMLLAGVVGSRLLHVLADGYFWDYVHLCTDPAQVSWKITQAECLQEPTHVWDAAQGVCHPTQQDCWAWAKFWNGGFTFYGGLLGAVPAAYYLLRHDRFPFWKATDMAGMAIPLGLGLGRTGCFLAGCCFGRVAEVSWAVSFPGYSPASSAQFREGQLVSSELPSLPVHPTQLYEAAGALLIALLLAAFAHGRKRYDGHVFVLFLASYAALRFLIEFFRADDRGGLLLLSTSQLIGLALVAAAVLLHRRLSARATDHVERSPA